MFHMTNICKKYIKFSYLLLLMKISLKKSTRTGKIRNSNANFLEKNITPLEGKKAVKTELTTTF